MDFKKDFPILREKVNGKPLAYLDNGATTQKPRKVLDSLKFYYEKANANVHRGQHYLGVQATSLFENSRATVARFINASSENTIFTKGTTEGINLVATCLARMNYFQEGDEIIISTQEHHANIVPWQFIEKYFKVKLKIIPINLINHTDTNNKNLNYVTGSLDLIAFENLITPKTKFISVMHVSNSLGIINPVKEIIEIAKNHKIPVLLDGAQAVPHFQVDVKELDCDFYVFSGHKALGPTGIGVLYAKSSWLEQMPPYQGGGEMITEVSFTKTSFQVPPYKFEAGTPNISGAIGLASAIQYIEEVGFDTIQKEETDIYDYLIVKILELAKISRINLYGFGKDIKKVPILSFLLPGYNAQDVGLLLDQFGVAVRTGHHCNMPLMQAFGIPGTIRVSLSFYNTKKDIDIFFNSLLKILELLQN